MITLYNCSVISYGMVSLSGAELGTFILQVTANDVDLNPILEYTFAPNGNPEGTFDIELYSGRITLAKPLDYEHKPRYTLLVQVCMVEEAYLITRRQHIFTLGMKGCFCHFVKWQIHPFISKGTKYDYLGNERVYSPLCKVRNTPFHVQVYNIVYIYM